jgi:hypothetical protein
MPLGAVAETGLELFDIVQGMDRFFLFLVADVFRFILGIGGFSFRGGGSSG